MSDSNSGGSAGIGLLGVLFVVFLVLKLTEVGAVATWSWWWVTAPLWGIPALILALAVTFLTARFVFGGIGTYLRRKRRMKVFMD